MKHAILLITAVSAMISLPHESLPAADRESLARRIAAPALTGYLGEPVFLRIIKEEHVLEMWVQHDDKWLVLKRYEIAAMSGDPGPKIREGDKQSPEGFYRVQPNALNPQSRYFLSFDIGYPNTYDCSLGRTGSHIMVHGSDVSVGCFAMTDNGIAEIYTMVAEALRAGQPYVPVQVYPFRMHPERMAAESHHPAFPHWQHLLPGWNYTEQFSAPYPDSDN